MAVNGTTRIGLTIAGVIAAVSVIFSAGITYARLSMHVEADEIHSNLGDRHRVIDNRVELKFGPRLDQIERRLADMDSKLDWLRKTQIERGGKP